MSIYIFFAMIDDLKANEHIDKHSLALEYKEIIQAYKNKYNNR